MTDIMAAAINLRLQLWGKRNEHPLEGAIGIGYGSDILHVFVRAKQFETSPFCSWHGFKVEWHYGIGDLVPQANA